MYRHSASIQMAARSLPSPAPDELTDGEAEVIAELEQKRRQIEEEIATFRAQKEKEFRNFEKDLRWKRKRSRSPAAKDAPPTKSGSSVTPSALSLLAAGAKPQTNGNTHRKGLSDGQVSPKSKPPPSKPTLSLDKLTINGTTTPLVPGTPPANSNALTRSLSRSPATTQIALTPPRPRLLSKSSTPPSVDRNDTSFAGLFVPAFLPLLDSRPHSEPSSPSQLQPSSQGPLCLTPEPCPVPAQQSLSSSLPHDSSPSLFVTHGVRALTVPTLPTTSMPSALRAASGTNVRKRKKVTFRLSDSAIVDPSSSYEEIPTPDLPSGGSSGQEKESYLEEAAEEAWGQDLNETHVAGAKEEVPVNEFVPVQLKASRQRTSSIDSTDSGTFIQGLQGAEDGGSGVGFFELDEELASPGVGEANPYNHVDDLEIDDVLEEPGGSGSDKKDMKHEGDEKTKDVGLRYGSFTSGSVPIDIVNRGNSWFGSYGH